MANIFKKRIALLYSHISVFLWGFTAVIGYLIHLKAVPLVWWRILICVLCLLPFTLKKQIIFFKTQRTNFWLSSLSGIVLATHWIFFYTSLKVANISIAVVCLSSGAFITCLLEAILFKKQISLSKIIISLMGCAGLLFMYGFEIKFRFGIFMGTIASILQVMVSLLNKKVVDKTETINVVCTQFIAGLAFLSLILIFTKGITGFHFNDIDMKDLSWLILLAIVFTLLPFYLSLYALKQVSAFTQNMLLNLEPVYAILIAFIFFDEGRHFGKGFFIGLFVLIVSVAVQTYFSSRDVSKKKNNF